MCYITGRPTRTLQSSLSTKYECKVRKRHVERRSHLTNIATGVHNHVWRSTKDL